MNVSATGIVFSNMHDEELHQLTSCRTMGALPFGGKYRLIDFALSNMHNSGIASVGVITKSKYQSLLDHIGSGKEWDLSRKKEGLTIFPPYGRCNSGFYKNKIEALYGVMDYIKRMRKNYVIITDCDALCNLNWMEPLNYHISKKADITIIYYQNPKIQATKKEAIYTISSEGYVTDLSIDYIKDENSCVGTNMWIVGKDFLENVINDAIAHSLEDFEKDIMQKKLDVYKIAAWKFDGYLRKINSIVDFFHANMDILNSTVREELFFENGLIYTKIFDEAPARFGTNANVQNSLISDGCVIEGNVENSILFRGVHVEKDAEIKNSIIMQDTKIGDNVHLNYVIADKYVLIRSNRLLMGYDEYPNYIKKGSNV